MINNSNDDILFVGMDIPKLVEKTLKDFDPNIEDEHIKSAYDMGVSNTLSFLRVLLETEKSNNEIVVNIPNLDHIEEYDIKDLIDYVNKPKG